MTDTTQPEPTKCENPGCGHALSMHNQLGYCRSRTTPDRTGECICAMTSSTARAAGRSVSGGET